MQEDISISTEYPLFWGMRVDEFEIYIYLCKIIKRKN